MDSQFIGRDFLTRTYFLSQGLAAFASVCNDMRHQDNCAGWHTRVCSNLIHALTEHTWYMYTPICIVFTAFNSFPHIEFHDSVLWLGHGCGEIYMAQSLKAIFRPSSGNKISLTKIRCLKNEVTATEWKITAVHFYCHHESTVTLKRIWKCEI